MAHAGEIVENTVTGERFRWHLTEAQTDGRLVRAELWVRPGGGVAVEHFHPHSEERFEVLEGRMTLERGGETHVLLGGDRDKVAPRVPHRWCNAGEEELHLFLELDDPHGFEDMIEDGFGALARGELRRDGQMKLLAGAAFAQRHAEAIVVTKPPPWLQRLIVPPLALLHRALSRGRAASAPAPSAT
jgi:mannose-6-phosphate isomerase-like protein (cupin superfamily)